MQLVLIQGARNLLGFGVGQGVPILAKARSSGPRARLQLAATSSPSRKLGCCRSAILAMNFHGLRPAAWKQEKTAHTSSNAKLSDQYQAAGLSTEVTPVLRAQRVDRERGSRNLQMPSARRRFLEYNHGFRHRLVSRQPWNRNLMLHAQPLGPYRRKTSHYRSEVVDTSTCD